MVISVFNDDTELSLSRIKDQRHNIEGYDTSIPQVKALFEKFKRSFLPRLEKDVQIKLKPEFFNF
jgi:hypothetical protein